MFEDLFTRRGIIARYHAAPLHDERLRYLKHCAQEGTPAGNVARNRGSSGQPRSSSRVARRRARTGLDTTSTGRNVGSDSGTTAGRSRGSRRQVKTRFVFTS